MAEEPNTPSTAAKDPPVITVLQLLDEPPGGIPLSLEVVTLTWHDRQRSRQRLVSDRGTELRLMLPRGTHLRDGDLLYADAQRQIRVKAQAEPVLLIQPENVMQMGQVLHQMGNWHRPAQISPQGQILLLADDPLRDWLAHMGIPFQSVLHAFEPNLLAHSH
ncbi:urease accessory protein UreE [Thermostichus vulcanus]|uniref:Urease accessory protein UreE n=1 Tax=Thermostichus vulcanus str. 'Rupite' TaxID=2813851 RepID=A0ABT0CAQ5_THEVL|nr:urease accessory protein UreE [Thermostichus vulcanus]MCJ2542867.1 urease accessory protein UreE [Thermostichus vulcanus str. 'Rupite']